MKPYKNHFKVYRLNYPPLYIETPVFRLKRVQGIATFVLSGYILFGNEGLIHAFKSLLRKNYKY